MPKKEKEKNKRKTHIVKNKGLRRVCAVVCLCFGLLSVSLPFVRSNGKISVSAADNSSLYPSDSYIFVTGYCPSFCVSWNSPSVTTLAYAPTLIVNKDKYYVCIGDTLVVAPFVDSVQNSVKIDVPFYNTASGTSVKNATPDYGFSIQVYADSSPGGSVGYDASTLYSLLGSGAIVFKSLDVVNVCTKDNVLNENMCYYEFLFNSSTDNTITYKTIIRLVRVDNDASSLSQGFQFYSNSSDARYFPYSWFYTGVPSNDAFYQRGYLCGYDNGYSKGYELGDTNGYTRGDSVGYQRGVNESLDNITPWGYIVNAVDWFFKIEIMPGVKLSLIFSIGFGVLMLGFVLKIFLGG